LGRNTVAALTMATSVKPTTSSGIGRERAQQNCAEDTGDEQAAIERELQRQQELQQELAQMQRSCTNVLFGLLGMQQTTRRLMAEREQLLDRLRPMMQELGLTPDNLFEMQELEQRPESQTFSDIASAMQDEESVTTEVTPSEASVQIQGRRRRGGRRHRRNRNRNQGLSQSQTVPRDDVVSSEPESAPTTEEAMLAISAMVARLPVAAMAA